MKKILMIVAALAFALTLGTAYAYDDMTPWTGAMEIRGDSLLSNIDPVNAAFDARFDAGIAGSAAGGIVPDHDTLLNDIGSGAGVDYTGPVKTSGPRFKENLLE